MILGILITSLIMTVIICGIFCAAYVALKMGENNESFVEDLEDY